MGLERRQSLIIRGSCQYPPQSTKTLVAFPTPQSSAATAAKQPNKAATMGASFLAGSAGGAMGSICCAPLDIVKTQMQVWGSINKLKPGEQQKEPPKIFKMLGRIVERNGVPGLFRGLGPTLLTVPTFWGVYFPLYERTKQFIPKVIGVDRSTITCHLTSAIIAGAAADVFTNPLWIVRTRMQTEAIHLDFQKSSEGGGVKRLSSIRQTVSSIYAEGGVLAFYRGLSASLLGLTHVAIQFPIYEGMKKEYRFSHLIAPENSDVDGPATPIDWVVASAVSKVIACLITYPHEVIRSRMMDNRCLSKPGGKNIIKLTRGE